MPESKNIRILVIDDNESIHADFRKILVPVEEQMVTGSALDSLEAAMFGATGKPKARPASRIFDLSTADQGQAGYEMVKQAVASRRPYAVAFVDMRMPPGWDGLETIRHLWSVDPYLQIVICTAYSDQSWEDVAAQLGETDRMLILKKPFDTIEVRQMASALTEKWNAERQARLKLDEMQTMVAEATDEIRVARDELLDKNALLESANERALAATQAKTDFLANMSHEIRTPLTAILGYTELIADPETPEADRQPFIQTIRRNGEHLLEVINEILDLSKVESGQFEVEQIDFAIRPLVESVRDLLSVRAESSGLQFAAEVDASVPETMCSDPTRIRQILINLLGNAIKFTREGHVRLRTTVSATNRILFTVEDSGIGMTKEQSESVFAPFTQADASTTREFGGTGLGLSLSRKLAARLGGTITVDSEPGRGSEFTFEVPCAATEPPAAHEPPPPPKPTPTPQKEHSVRPCRVLLVDDGLENQQLFSFMLRRAGADVVIANNGAEGIEAFRTADEPFDVVMMDMQMPVMDGYEATRTLRAEDRFEGPILALTARAMSGDERACIDAGCNDYATKPIGRTDLIDLLNRHLGPESSMLK